MDYLSTLSAKIENRSARVGIIGLGYVGLPLAFGFLRAGFHVTGFDVDAPKVAKLKAGESYIGHIQSAEIAKWSASDAFFPTSDFAELAKVDAIIICVPTPLTKHREPDMTYVVATTEQITKHAQKGQLCVLESTTYPGTTRELLSTAFETAGFHVGEDFFLAFSPEREDPGNTKFNTVSIPKVVGGVDDASTQVAVQLYEGVIQSVVKVSSAEVAEATKLTENIFRAVNIALVNELKLIYDRMGLDVWEVLDACETKPFGFMRFNPGPGLGGHCIPLDPFYLTWKAREFGLSTRFIELAGEVNVRMPEHVIAKTQSALNDRGAAIKDASILILGLAYKKNVSDTRESPSFEIIEQLLAMGAQVQYHDPHVPQSPSMRSWPTLPAMNSVPLNAETLQNQDAVIIVTDHDNLDYQLVQEKAKLVVDTRGRLRGPISNVVRA